MPRTGLYIQTVSALTPDGLYSQPDVATLLEQQCTVGKKLGEGSFGAAFLVERTSEWPQDPEGKAWVVKLPRTMLVRNIFGKSLAEAVRPHVNAKVLRDAQADFEKECRNAEAILDPPYLQELRQTHARMSSPGSRLQDLTLEERTRLAEATLDWRAPPGYAHLHPLLHYDPNVPMLISARAIGTLSDTRIEQKFRIDGGNARDPPEWRRVAEHLSAAVAFLNDHTRMAHMDIKPDNVFVVEAEQLVYRLGDYGICRRQDERATYFLGSDRITEQLCGTPLYNPPKPSPATPMTYGQATLFQCFATLLGTLYLPKPVDAFLDVQKSLVSVHSAAQSTKGHLQTCLTDAATKRPLFALVMGALREPDPAQWPVKFRALRALFA